MADIKFTQQVVVITGAGGGLGRTYALEIARRGGKVVVNDFGGEVDGSGGGKGGGTAASVVQEIESAGGEAIAVACNISHKEQCNKYLSSLKDVSQKDFTL